MAQSVAQSSAYFHHDGRHSVWLCHAAVRCVPDGRPEMADDRERHLSRDVPDPGACSRLLSQPFHSEDPGREARDGCQRYAGRHHLRRPWAGGKGRMSALCWPPSSQIAGFMLRRPESTDTAFYAWVFGPLAVGYWG